MANKKGFLGREVGLGLGIEATAGTAVVPQVFMRHLSSDFQRAKTRIINDSAMGRVEKNNDSEVVEKWAEGKIEGKVGDITVGYMLLNMMGVVVTTTNADASTLVKDHTFDIAQLVLPPSLTIARKDPVASRRHALGYLEQLEFSVEKGGWVTVVATVKSKMGTTSTETVSVLVDTEFTAKHMFAKIAANVAGLGAATKIGTQTIKLTLSRPVTPYIPNGSDEPTEMDLGEWTANGELTLRYDDTTYEDLSFANTIRALQIGIINTDKTIGTAANPGLVFTAPRARLSEFSLSSDLPTKVIQTVGFDCELDTVAGYLIRVVLTNLQTAYASA
ncbi:phage tail tube protein [Streptomyces sp. NPDC056401]|uniref:phage tail tube protein n=1 Tax=Streptomyces sp. NPDC056401 TaxID=3345809 RepID=UPI0035DE1814